MEDEFEFFRDKDGKIKYASKCYNCTKSCRQSFRAKIVSCKNYQDRRTTTPSKMTKRESLKSLDS